MYLTDYRVYLIGVPILVAISAAIGAVLFFYPAQAFVWGDQHEYHTTLAERRKFLWYGVVFSLAIGVLGNLFVLGVSTFAQHQ
jgi:hypothetical protein